MLRTGQSQDGRPATGLAVEPNTAGENLTRGSTRVLGRAKNQLLRAFGYAACNLRMLDAFARRTTRDDTCTPPRTRKPRRTHTTTHLLADITGQTVSSRAPPEQTALIQG